MDYKEDKIEDLENGESDVIEQLHSEEPPKEEVTHKVVERKTTKKVIEPKVVKKEEEVVLVKKGLVKVKYSENSEGKGAEKYLPAYLAKILKSQGKVNIIS